MLTQMQAKNFKSWADTGPIRLAPLTGFFGTNSSGKSSLLQTLLLFKLTTESNDRNLIFDTYQEGYADLGTIQDILRHSENEMGFSLSWKIPKDQAITLEYDYGEDGLFTERNEELSFKTNVSVDQGASRVTNLEYEALSSLAYMDYLPETKEYDVRIQIDGTPLVNPSKGKIPVTSTLKSYGFSNEAIRVGASFLYDFNLAFEQLFKRVHYLGPLREYPRRVYNWSGEIPSNVGTRGELAIPALIAMQNSPEFEEKILRWLDRLEMASGTGMRRIAPNLYQFLVRNSPSGPSVSLADVGFGISQILPILVQCYYVPKGSILIIEQPEIHLHPSVQAGLADVFIDAIKTRGIQIIVESHSEHFLRRLQRRIAEGVFDNDDAALYFCEMEQGESHIERLDVDEYGNIRNWPKHFFGDMTSDLYEMVMAGTKRQIENGAK